MRVRQVVGKSWPLASFLVHSFPLLPFQSEQSQSTSCARPSSLFNCQTDVGISCPTCHVSLCSWPNVYTNLKNIDYCTDQFSYIT